MSCADVDMVHIYYVTQWRREKRKRSFSLSVSALSRVDYSGRGYMDVFAVLSGSPHSLVTGSCQHFWRKLRRFVRAGSIVRILSHLVLNKVKHYFMESCCIKHGIMGPFTTPRSLRHVSYFSSCFSETAKFRSYVSLWVCRYWCYRCVRQCLRECCASPLLCGPHWWKRRLAGKHRFHRPGGGCGCGVAGGGRSWRTPSAKHKYVDIR